MIPWKQMSNWFSRALNPYASQVWHVVAPQRGHTRRFTRFRAAMRRQPRQLELAHQVAQLDHGQVAPIADVPGRTWWIRIEARSRGINPRSCGYAKWSGDAQQFSRGSMVCARTQQMDRVECERSDRNQGTYCRESGRR